MLVIISQILCKEKKVCTYDYSWIEKDGPKFSLCFFCFF